MTKISATPFGPGFPDLLATAAVLATLAAPAAAQLIGSVAYGDQAWNGSITAVSQTQRFLMVGQAGGAQAGDILRITFASQSCCNPTYYYHDLSVLDGATQIGSITGLGDLTLTLPRAGIYTIEVRAHNNQSTGWYAFQLDRLNNPVGADRIAFDWTMEGNIAAATGFDIFTVQAQSGSSGLLRLTSQSCCNPTYYYHQVELLDAAGQPVTGTGSSPVAVIGNGSSAVTFPATGTYMLLVRARNYQSTGWYVMSLECQSWPGTPCGTIARCSSFGNFALGRPGPSGQQPLPCANGVQPLLSCSVVPRLGTTARLDVSNPHAQPSQALVLYSLDAGNTQLTTFGCRLLLSSPSILTALVVPASGQATLSYPIPNLPFLTGIGFALQSVVADPNAGPPAWGAGFSRPVMFVMGQ